MADEDGGDLGGLFYSLKVVFTSVRSLDYLAMNDANAEFHVLTTPEGKCLLAEVAAVRKPEPVDLMRWRKTHSTVLVSAALRLVESRRKGKAKFVQAGEMWLEPKGVEQATGEAVARHKAKRFAGADVADLC